MLEMDDIRLLRDYADHQSEAAFAELVRRHVNLVHSVALRQTGNPHTAEEITQAVFLVLAHKAGSLGRNVVLSGWLYQTARLTAANHRRTESRRMHREQEAYMQSLVNEPQPDAWPQIKPLLEDAMAKLCDRDRDAIVLRFFEGKPLSEVGAALGASEAAAKVRVGRALEKLRKHFSRNGISRPAAALGGIIAANAVQASPAALTASILAAAGGSAVVAASTSTLMKGVLELVTITQLKLGIVGAVVALGVATPVILQQRTNARLRAENEVLRQQTAPSVVAQAPPPATNDIELARVQQEHLELLRLRGEVGRLRARTQELARLQGAIQRSSSAPAANSVSDPVDLPKESWTDAGFASPAAVLQTRGWAVVNGNRERFKESLYITDGAKKIMEGMLAQMIATSPDPTAARKQIADNGLGLEDAMLFPMMAEDRDQSYTGYRVLSQQAPTVDERILAVETTMASGAAKQEDMKFQRIGSDWKLVIDEDTIRAQIKRDQK